MSSSDVPIPMELVVQILVELPVKSLLRFKCVCKSWYALIQSSMFINMQLRYASSIEDNHRIILKHCLKLDTSSIHVSFDHSMTDVPVPVSLFDPDVPNDFVTFYGPCNGIICAQADTRGDLISLWSPATRQLKRLPLFAETRVHPEVPPQFDLKLMTLAIGFGFDFKTNDYKVVRILDWILSFDYFPYHASVNSQVEVYNLSTNRWRKIDVVVPYKGHLYKERSVYIDGLYYWCSDSSYGQMFILSFDFASERFDTIHLPVHMEDKHILTLLKYRESPAIVVVDDEDKERDALWVLTKDNDGMNTWLKLFTVCSSDTIVGFLRNGDALIQTLEFPNNRLCRSYSVRTYDHTSQRFKDTVAYDDIYRCDQLQVVNYVESLVSL